MARPTKCRRVEFFPEQTYYTPCRGSACGGRQAQEEINLKIEELEAMRLKDLEDLNQDECAARMQISRQTFQNVLDSARKKVALALTEGKAIRISGGQYTTKHCQLYCGECGAHYEVSYEQDRVTCPACGSHKVYCVKKQAACRRFCQADEDEEQTITDK